MFYPCFNFIAGRFLHFIYGRWNQGMNDISVGATRIAIVISVAYRVVELIFKDEYNLVGFFVNITMDTAKLAVSAQITAVATGGLVTLDDKYGISEAIIKTLKSHRAYKPETSYHRNQFFSQFGRFSHG